MITTTKMAPMKIGFWMLSARTSREESSTSYCIELMGRLACPMMRRFTE